MKLSLAGIEQLGTYMSQLATATPFLGLLTPALSLASIVSQRAITSHAKPEKVLTIDMNFLLAGRRKGEVKPSDGGEIPFEQRSGEYLRYGYYFFLDKRVEAKLYASFRTFPNVQLMVKRAERELGGGERRYFPLTGVSYLVIRVTGRVFATAATRRPIVMSHVQRLEDVLRWSVRGDGGGGDEARSIVKAPAALARNVGIGAEGAQGAAPRGDAKGRTDSDGIGGSAPLNLIK